MDFSLPIDISQLPWFFRGLFFVLFLAVSIKLARRPRHYYSKQWKAKIPAELIITEDSEA